MFDCIRCAGSGVVPARNGRVAVDCPDCKGTGQTDDPAKGLVVGGTAPPMKSWREEF